MKVLVMYVNEFSYVPAEKNLEEAENISAGDSFKDRNIRLINRRVPHEFPGDDGCNYSIGFHPWDIHQYDIESTLEKLEELATQELQTHFWKWINGRIERRSCWERKDWKNSGRHMF